MKKLLLAPLAAFLVIFCSCDDEDEEEAVPPVEDVTSDMAKTFTGWATQSVGQSSGYSYSENKIAVNVTATSENTLDIVLGNSPMEFSDGYKVGTCFAKDINVFKDIIDDGVRHFQGWDFTYISLSTVGIRNDTCWLDGTYDGEKLYIDFRIRHDDEWAYIEFTSGSLIAEKNPGHVFLHDDNVVGRNDF